VPRRRDTQHQSPPQKRPPRRSAEVRLRQRRWSGLAGYGQSRRPWISRVSTRSEGAPRIVPIFTPALSTDATFPKRRRRGIFDRSPAMSQPTSVTLSLPATLPDNASHFASVDDSFRLSSWMPWRLSVTGWVSHKTCNIEVSPEQLRDLTRAAAQTFERPCSVVAGRDARPRQQCHVVTVVSPKLHVNVLLRCKKRISRARRDWKPQVPQQKC
jgi:hypothetical protein